MTLTLNPGTGAFVLTSNDDAKAIRAGLTLSTSQRGQNGERVWYTADYEKRPAFNPYAAVPFHQEADDRAMQALGPLVRDYLASWAHDTEADYPAPDRINPKTDLPFDYMPYQRAGIEYALKRDHVLIGDEPGLGKTIQAIGIANATEAERVLVLCPASIRLGWQREVLDWSTIPRVSTYPILKSRDGVSPLANYVIISYDLLRNLEIHEALCERRWDMVVADEAHYLKTVEAVRTRAVFGGGEGDFAERFLNDHTDRFVALTGTPLPNRPRECYTLARGLCHEAIDWMSQDRFEFRFNPSMQIDDRTVREETGRTLELNARLRCNLMVRRHKRDVLDQLPDKQYEMIYVEPNGKIKELLRREALIDFDPRDLFNPDFELDGTPIATLRREMGEAMVPRVVEHVKTLLDIVGIDKIMLFAHHRSVINMLVESLHQYGIVLRHGSVSARNKQLAIDEFVRDPKIRIHLGQLDTMEGADGLQHVCSYGVFAEPAWTPGRNEQCVDRGHRIGQHDNFIAQFLLAEGSFNEKVLQVVLGKAHNIHETLDERF